MLRSHVAASHWKHMAAWHDAHTSHFLRLLDDILIDPARRELEIPSSSQHYRIIFYRNREKRTLHVSFFLRCFYDYPLNRWWPPPSTDGFIYLYSSSPLSMSTALRFYSHRIDRKGDPLFDLRRRPPDGRRATMMTTPTAMSPRWWESSSFCKTHIDDDCSFFHIERGDRQKERGRKRRKNDNIEGRH